MVSRLLLTAAPWRTLSERLWAMSQTSTSSGSVNSAKASVSGLESLLREIDIPDIALNNDDITSNFVSIDFALRAQRSDNDITFCFKAKLKESGSPIPPETEGIFAWQILFPEVKIAFWASMNVTSMQEGDVVALNCCGMRLRGIIQLSDDQSFDDFVAEASAEAGISLVIKAGVVSWSEDTVQKVANRVGIR